MGPVPSAEKHKKERKKEKPFASQASTCLANTNKKTCIVSLELAKHLSRHPVTNNTLIQMVTPAQQPRQFSSVKTVL